MKKLFTLLLFLSFASISFGQNKFFVLKIDAKDSLNNTYSGTVDIHYMNTDSTVNGYKIHNLLTFSGGSYMDTIYYDSNYTANLFTIHHRACGSWTPFYDTSFSPFGTLHLTITVPCPKTCNAGFTYQQLSNGQVIFWANQSLNGQVHSWNFGDGHSASPQDSVSHTYTQNGTYTVRHMVYDSIKNCYDSTGQQIVVSNINPCDAGFTAAKQGNSNHVSFVADDRSGGLVHHWYFGDGNYSTPSDSTYNIYSQNGTYTATHILYDSINNCSDSVSQQVVINSFPTCDAGFTATQHGGGYVTFVAHDRSNGLVHQWYFGDGNSASPFDSTFNGYTQNGTYTVIHMVYDSINNCYDSSGQQIVINNISPQCDAGFTATQHGSGYVTFVAHDRSNGLVHQWYFGDGNSASPFDSTANGYTQNGTYTVIHMVYDSINNCYDSSGQQIVINNIVGQCDADFSFNIYSGGYVHFVPAQNSSGMGHYWYFGNGNSSISDTAYHTYTQNGTYYVTHLVIDSLNNCSDSVTKQVVINGSCIADFSYFRSGINIQFNGTVYPSTASRFWDFGDGQTGTGNDPSHAYNSHGTYNVKLIIADSANNCYDTIIKQVVYSCNAGFSHTLLPGGQVIFVAYDRTPGLQHDWDFGDASTSSGPDSVSHNYAQNGTYYVWHSVYDSVNQCFDTAYVGIQVYTICNADFSFATNNLSASFTSHATPSGMTHNWNFGGLGTSSVTNPSFTFPSAGTYSVKLKISNGSCIDSIVKAVSVFQCNAGFQTTFVSNYNFHFTRNDSSSGIPVWHFGDGDSSTAQNPYHTYSSAGYKYITLKIYDSNGNLKCSSNGYVYMNTCGGQGYDYLYGDVLFSGQSLHDYDSVRVYLIEYDPTAGILTALDSMDIYNQDTGNFYFDLCSYSTDSFLVKAACLPGSKYYSTYLPTYADSALLWSGARRIPYGYVYNADVYMKSGSNSGGPGFIGGYVSQGANKSGDLLDGIEVILLTGSGDPVAYTYTTNGGRYEFHNLAYGTYRVRVEIPGLPSEEYVVTLDQQNPLKDDNNFEVNTMGINKPNGIIYLNKEDLKVYPVPATDKLTLEIVDMTMDKGTYFITDINGREVSKGKLGEDSGNHSYTIPVAQLGSGYYILNLNSATHSGKISFIKH